MDTRYRIIGGIPLQGEVDIGGSKNAALPLMAACLITDGTCVLHNVPRIRDTEAMLSILEFLGAKTTFEGNTVSIDTSGVESKTIPSEYVSKLRASIVLLGPLLARFGVVEMAYPGGCPLGKRPIGAHVEALVQMGALNMSTEHVLHLQGNLRPSRVILPEISVTATENALMVAALLPGETRIDLAACEPHVQDVSHMLVSMGATIDGIGTHTLIVRGTASPAAVSHTVISDYLEAGVFALAAFVTRGKLRLKNIEIEHLISFLDALRRCGAVWKYDSDDRVLFVDGELSILNALSVKTNIFPGFPTDLQAPMGVLMTQAKGVSRVFETLFEGRMAYLYELEKMGAHVEILNAHQALIIGPTPLRGRIVASNDIRAGAAMVLAGLCADGETIITDIKYIERGYEKFEEKLRSVGAAVDRLEYPT